MVVLKLVIFYCTGWWNSKGELADCFGKCRPQLEHSVWGWRFEGTNFFQLFLHSFVEFGIVFNQSFWLTASVWFWHGVLHCLLCLNRSTMWRYFMGQKESFTQFDFFCYKKTITKINHFHWTTTITRWYLPQKENNYKHIRKDVN